MMTFDIQRQESYSRGELLLRTFFGLFYILLPHAIVLIFVGIASSILNFLSFWIILFTGRYPESWFEFQVKYMRWNIRLNASLFNLVDGYPKFGLDAQHPGVTFDVAYPEQISKGSVLLRFFFGWLYVGLPHGLILGLLAYAALIVNFIAWWAVLFTGSYPKSMFDFQVKYFRWSQRVSCYLAYMTQEYPPFSGSPDPDYDNTNVADAQPSKLDEPSDTNDTNDSDSNEA
ncbi:MAG: hypothetical protein Salg2KO_18380 [Salibacteraceae bacterium]